MSADHAGLEPDYAARRGALRSLLVENEVDALLVTDLVNIRYLTGFTGSNAALLVHSWDMRNAEERTVIGTDGRYLTQVAEQVPDLRAEIARATARRIVELAGSGNWAGSATRVTSSPSISTVVSSSSTPDWSSSPHPASSNSCAW